MRLRLSGCDRAGRLSEFGSSVITALCQSKLKTTARIADRVREGLRKTQQIGQGREIGELT